MELRQSPAWGKYLESLGWKTEVIDGCALRVKSLGLLGSIIKIQRPESLPLDKIEAFARKSRALFVKIEPSNETQVNELTTNNYKLDTWPLTPARTVILDITKSEEDLLKSFSKDVRQSIRKSQTRNLEYQITDLAKIPSFHAETYGNRETRNKFLNDFYQIWKQTGDRGDFWVPPFNEYTSEVAAFSGNGFFVLSYLEGKHLVSGCLILLCDGVAYYHHAASTLEGQNIHSPYWQMWQAIREAKSRGCTKMDLEGIFDPRFKSMFKKWLNFSAFKLKWGGEVYEYPGSFTKTYNPLINLLFRLNR